MWIANIPLALSLHFPLPSTCIHPPKYLMLRIINASLALTPKDIFHLTPLITPITYKAFPPKLPWQNSPQVSSDLSDLFTSLLYSCTLLHSTLKMLQLLQSQPFSFDPHSTLPPWVTASVSTCSITSWKSLEFHILIPVFIATNLKWSEVAQLCSLRPHGL